MTLMEKQRTAELRGIEIGENRGIAIGEDRGIAIGEKKSYEIARRMISGKLPLEQIAYCSGLALSEIQALVEEMGQEKKKKKAIPFTIFMELPFFIIFF